MHSALRQCVKPCPKCPFAKRNSKVATVGSRGNPESPFVIVGESPGMKEARKGLPFVGPSGDVLWRTLPEGEETDVYILNALQCLPYGKDQVTLNQATHACHERLIAEVTAHPRKLVLALGNPAMWSLTGNYAMKITQDRGMIIPNHVAEIGVLPAVHPAALMRGVGTYRHFKHDLLYAVDLVNGHPQKGVPKVEFTVWDTAGGLQRLVKTLTERPCVHGADIETTGLDVHHDRILSLGITWTQNHVAIIPGEALQAFKDILMPLFEAEHIKWLWHNGKFDISFLRRADYGFPARVDEDSMLMSYALDEQGGVHGLEQVAMDLIGAPSYKAMLKPYLPNKKTSYEVIPKPILYDYQARDVDNTKGIAEIMRRRIAADPALEKLYTRTLIPASNMLVKVEANGIYVDRARLELNDVKLKAEIKEALANFTEAAGKEVNPQSPKQVAALLYDDLKLPIRHGRSTGKEILERLPQVPAVQALRKHRVAAKAHSTYVVSFIEKINERTGRIYTSFLIHGTRTGRLSSRGPNVQNIPRKEELRSMFHAPAGRLLIEIDLNQAELRSLAALSGDPDLCHIYNTAGMSLHDEVSIELFGKDFTHEDKMRAKAVNFGIVYGREAPSLAEDFNISINEGQRMVDGWFNRFPVAHKYIRKCRAAPMRNQSMTTVFGNRKRVGIVSRTNLKALMNEASNFPHQNIASNINLHAAIETIDIIEEQYDALIVNLIHDSILVEAPISLEAINGTIRAVKKAMESIPPRWGLTRIPFLAEAKIGKSWGCLKDYDPDNDNLVDVILKGAA